MLTLHNDHLRITVSPQGGAVTSARTVAGRDFLRPLLGPFSVRATACYPLVPLGNRVGGNRFTFDGRTYALRPNATDPLYLHGDGWLSDWTVEQAGKTRADLLLETRAPDLGVHTYRARQTFLLRQNCLRIEMEVTNLAPDAMPFGLGLHPFMPHNDAEITFSAAAFWTEGEGSLPLIRRPVAGMIDFSAGQGIPDMWLNNAYEGWDGRASVRWPDGIGLEIRADPIFRHLMVYAPDTDRSFFCLEPMTHLPNAVNRPDMPAMDVLAQGQSLSGAVEFTLMS
ncbi:MAG: aldose 1-epimerase [Paracoccus denitrificans]|uniref:Aldose 1-epimerase n=1 Tax=Paracoccus denitrificans TaxID=266 RepID=A0A533I1F0_PARDE|nr:MAG: aldose 1-epimerase [Paracoccus denitrificans]